MRISVENLTFAFPETWTVIKFDDTAFYRRQFSKMWEKIKAVDLIAVTENEKAYLIEVKDYRIAQSAGPSSLPSIVAQKVFDTLAAQIPCMLNANDLEERNVSWRVCRCTSLVVVLHLEQPERRTGIFRPYDAANLQSKLKQLLKPIHARPLVLRKDKLESVSWAVE